MSEEKKEAKEGAQKPAAQPEQAQAKEAQTQQSSSTQEDKPKVDLSAKAQKILETVEGMTVLELSNLVKAFEDKFGVTAAAQVVAGAMPMAGGAAAGAAQEEEKAAFTVVLASVGGNKIQVIKEIRAVTTLGLKEAKDLVDSAPKPVKEDVPKQEAEEIKKKLEAAGAKVELK
jgi:large subunit ribosomal protein L7/L12